MLLLVIVFRLASVRKYLKINSTEISSEVLANDYYFSIYDNAVINLIVHCHE